MKKVLITGGTGVVGQTLVRYLINNGYLVRILSRSRRSVCSNSSICAIERQAESLSIEPAWPEHGYRIGHNTLKGRNQKMKVNDYSRLKGLSYKIVQGDITDPDVLACAVKGVSIVFHLAAMVGTHSFFQQNFDQYKNLFDQYRDVNVRGTELLIKAAVEEGVDRVVFFSSISVYGKRKKAFPADEFTSLSPDSFYSISKAEAEKYVLAGVNHRGKPIGVVLRAASVYGPKEKKNYTRLIKLMKHGFFITIGHGMTKRTLIHDSDLARAAIIAAEHPDACGKIYNVTDGSVHSLNDLRQAIGKACGKKHINIYLPENLVNCFISLLEKFKIGVSLASGLKNFVMDTAILGNRIQDELGFKPVMKLDNGWKDAVERTKKENQR